MRKKEVIFVQSVVLEINSDFDQVFRAKEKIFSIIESHIGCINDEIMFAFYELVNNAIEHGNKFDPSKKVVIELDITEHHIQLTIEDEGEGFQWLDKIKKELDHSDFSERGRGIIMSKLCCDEIIYNDRGNRVSIVKSFNNSKCS